MEGEVRKRLSEAMEDISRERLWSVSGELNTLKVLERIKKKPSKEVQAAIQASLEVVEDFLEFLVEVHSEAESADYSEKASLYDLAAIGALAVQDAMPRGEGVTLSNVLLGAFSEGLILLGSRQYVAGAKGIVDARLRIHSHRVYTRLWDLPVEFKKQFSEDDVEALRGSIDSLFDEIGKGDVPTQAKVEVLFQFYSLILAVQIGKLIRTMT